LIDVASHQSPSGTVNRIDLSGFDLPVLLANAQEITAHEEVLVQLDKASGQKTVWREVARTDAQ
jgi:DNA polymerase-3 subunit epsilon